MLIHQKYRKSLLIIGFLLLIFARDLRSPHVKKTWSILFREHNENAAPVTSFLAKPPQMAILYK